MRRFCFLILAVFLSCPLAVFAQNPGSTAAASAAPAAAGQFDFLLGQWQLVVHPKVSSLAAMIHGTPKLIGTLKAWRAGSDVEDEISITDNSGNPLSANHSLRTYDAAQARWKISGRDARKGRSGEATGHWQDGEMRLEGYSTDADGKTLTRTRYYGITADSFHMTQDISVDDGKTWEEGTLTIDATRVATTATPG
jgi:hypothetical protein